MGAHCSDKKCLSGIPNAWRQWFPVDRCPWWLCLTVSSQPATVGRFSMHLSVVIPCFNEAQTIPRLATSSDLTVAELQAAGHRPEILVVDDGSSDGSAGALKSACAARPWLRVIVLRRNSGQTAAMSAGFAAAVGDVIIPMDADMQNDPADIPRLLAKLDEGFDVVSGWRRLRKDKFWTRKLPSWIANKLIGWVSGVPCTITGAR